MSLAAAADAPEDLDVVLARALAWVPPGWDGFAFTLPGKIVSVGIPPWPPVHPGVPA